MELGFHPSDASEKYFKKNPTPSEGDEVQFMLHLNREYREKFEDTYYSNKIHAVVEDIEIVGIGDIIKITLNTEFGDTVELRSRVLGSGGTTCDAKVNGEYVGEPSTIEW